MMAQHLSHTHSARCLKNIMSYNVKLFLLHLYSTHSSRQMTKWCKVQEPLGLYDILQLGYLSVISQVYRSLKAASSDFGCSRASRKHDI